MNLPPPTPRRQPIQPRPRWEAALILVAIIVAALVGAWLVYG